MPFPNFHAARLKNPDAFIKESFVTKPIENGDILLILAKLKSDGTSGNLKTQAIRFKSSKFSVAEAKKWLSEHGHKPISFEAATGKEDEQKRYYKTFPFAVTETKELNTDKGHFGIIRGYASTYGNLDRGGDIVVAGAFTKSIERYKGCRRPIKMQYQHDRLEIIGGFPCDRISEDEKGLFVEGQINLDVQRGREVYALAKQGVLSDMSIGFSIISDERDEQGNTLLKQLELWEISVVGEPMNAEAKITQVKSLGSNVELAPMDTEWDVSGSIERIKKFTRSDEKPSEDYGKAFMWFDSEKSEDFESYKMPYVDIVDGQLKVVPKAIFAIAAILRSARGGTYIAAEDRRKIIDTVNAYYVKMGVESPLKTYYDNTVVCKDVNWTSTKEHVNFLLENFDVSIDINDCRNSEHNLREAGFSKQAANLLIRIYKKELGEPVQTVEDTTEVFMCLEQVSAKLSRIASLIASLLKK